MRDRLTLLIAGLLTAASAAAYFRFFGEAGIWLIVWGSMVVLILDNRKFRREVERLRGEQRRLGRSWIEGRLGG
jgi:hypothetical protein